MEIKCVRCKKIIKVSSKRRKFCSKECYHNFLKGRKLPEKTKKKMSDSQKRINNRPPVMEKENHPQWKGGITSETTKIRRSKQYREWRKKILKRDNYTCQNCGATDKEKILHADHIKPFAYLINQIRDIYGNIIIEQINEFKELWDLNNGRTLCIDCHRKTKCYKNRQNAILGVN